jgi:hypothetical protein
MQITYKACNTARAAHAIRMLQIHYPKFTVRHKQRTCSILEGEAGW